MSEPTHVSKDDLESLEFMIEQFEKAQYALQAFQQYLSAKYLKQGDVVTADGEIVRAANAPTAAEPNKTVVPAQDSAS